MSNKLARKVGSKSHEVDLRDLEIDENKILNFAPSPKEKVNFNLDIREYHKHTEEQIEVLNTMQNYHTKCVLMNCVWGSGKSYCAVLSALKLLKSGVIRKIYYVRNPVEASLSATIGTLPGELNDRLASFNAIIFDKLQEFLPTNQINRLIQEGYIEFIPPGLIRGRSFSHSILLCEEVGDFAFQDFTLVASRLGEKSKIYFIGDSFQSSIRNSGFEKFYELMDDQESRDNGVFCYSWRDAKFILRSGFVRFLMGKIGAIKTEK